MKNLCRLVFLLCFLKFGQPQLQQDACELVQACLTNAQEKFEECQTKLEDGRQNNRTVDPCFQELKALIEEKRSFHKQKEENFAECLNEHDDSGLNSLNPRKQEKCAAIMRRFSPAAQKSDAKFRRQLGPRALGRRFGNGNGRRRGQNRGRRKEFKICMKQAKQARKSCKPVVKCCPKAALCHLEYELSETHDRIKRLQMQILKKRQECRSQNERSADIRRRDPLSDDIENFDIVTEDQIMEAD